MKSAVRFVLVLAPIFSVGCGSSAPAPTPEAVKSEIQQLDENRERERMNK